MTLEVDIDCDACGNHIAAGSTEKNALHSLASIDEGVEVETGGLFGKVYLCHACKGALGYGEDHPKKAVCFDFDGVIHDYGTWKGYEVIDGPPVEGIVELIQELKAEGYTIYVHSVRAAVEPGRRAIDDWMSEHGIIPDWVTKFKPIATLYVDDRGYRFTDAHNAGKVIRRLVGKR